MKRSVIANALVLVPVLCCGLVFGQKAIGGSAGSPPPPPPPPPPQSRDAIAGYVFGEDNARNAEELAELVVSKLAASRKYSEPKRKSREFFALVDQLESRKANRNQLPDDRDFCRIGGSFGVNFLCIMDIEKAGRGASTYARIINLSTCQVVGTAEFTGLIRNSAEIEKAASDLSRDLLNHRMFRRGGLAWGPPTPPPPPPPPPKVRGNAIAGYVFGEDNVRNAEELAEAVVNGLVNDRKYSQPKRRSAEFFREVEKAQDRAERRGKLLDDRDFCRIGDDFGVDFLCVIDIEKAGRGASIWARVINLDNCALVATGESTALIRNTAEINKVASELVSQLTQHRVGRRSGR
jgi:hypothetical protein